MPVDYQHESPVNHPVLNDKSDVTLRDQLVTFWVLPIDGGNPVPVETPCALLGSKSPFLFQNLDGSVHGCLIVDVDTTISGRIVRTHAHGIGEDDTGTFSGTHG
jgi:hypothetical protein